MWRKLAVVVLLGGAVAASAAEPPNATQSLQRFFSEVRSYTADFEQVVLDESKQVLQEARGRMWIERPAKFRWSYETPYKQQIVSDGERLWVYDQDLDQVTVRPLERSLQDTPALLLAGRGSIEDQFDAKELAPDGLITWVQLRPKRKDSGFAEIRLGFEHGKLRVFELRDAFDQVTRYRMRNASENISIDPARFTFTPPSGADVVGAP